MWTVPRKFVLFPKYQTRPEKKHQTYLLRETVRRYDVQHNDSQPNDIQQKDTQHKGLICDTQHNDIQYK